MKFFFLKFSLLFAACSLCILLQSTFGLSSVFSAAIIGFMGSFTPYGPIIYVGAFAGMSSPLHLNGPVSIFFISVVGATVYLFTHTRVKGFGGKLGTIAFVSSLILICSKRLW